MSVWMNESESERRMLPNWIQAKIFITLLFKNQPILPYVYINHLSLEGSNEARAVKSVQCYIKAVKSWKYLDVLNHVFQNILYSPQVEQSCPTLRVNNCRRHLANGLTSTIPVNVCLFLLCIILVYILTLQSLRIDTRNSRVSCIVFRVFLIHEITYTKFYRKIHNIHESPIHKRLTK